MNTDDDRPTADDPRTYPEGHAMTTDDHNAEQDLLDHLDGAAASIRPDPRFTDRLWAELQDLRSEVPTWARPAGQEAPAIAAPAIPVLGEPPVQRRRSASRWASPLTTIAAALVVAMIGFGALSMSGADPGDLLRQEVPNASAQGMAGDGHDVVGTWVIYGGLTLNGYDQLITFNAGGGVTMQVRGVLEPWFGTWEMTEDGRVAVDISTLIPPTSVQEQFQPDALFLPSTIRMEGSFRLSADGSTWEDERFEAQYIVFLNNGVPNPQPRLLPMDDSSETRSIGRLSGGNGSPERLESAVLGAMELTPQQVATFQAGTINQPGSAHDGRAEGSLEISATPTIQIPAGSLAASAAVETPVPTITSSVQEGSDVDTGVTVTQSPAGPSSANPAVIPSA
ncbi:MAG TPA: hypothetical protein VGT61_16185 [Thermomicrobiales bacterium]|jgi:hypothetical protein|nr:hypothetical protein [Thermomicrobiales bacterium]